MALISGIEEAKILEIKKEEIHQKASQSIKTNGWLPNLFRSIVSKAKEFLQNLIRQTALPPKPVLNMDMAEFRIMQKLMIRVQDRAREIRSLQEEVPKLKAQLAETKGIFKGKERKALETQIQQTEEKISAAPIPRQRKIAFISKTTPQASCGAYIKNAPCGFILQGAWLLWIYLLYFLLRL